MKVLRIPLLLLLLTAGFYWRLTLTDQYTWLNSPDLSRQVLPWFQFQVGEIQRGRIPLWDPYAFGGQPLHGQAQPGMAYPLNWILFALPTRQGWIKASFLHWYFVLIHFMAVAFTYKLCRDQGLARLPSTLGGVLYGMGGYMGVIDWPQMMNGAVWAPLVLMFVLRCLRGERMLANAALGGLCLGVSVLSGHHQVPTFIGLMALALWVWGALESGRVNFAYLRPVAAFFVIAGLVSALQTLPAWEYSKLAVRWVGLDYPVGHDAIVPYTIHEHYSLRSYLLLNLFIPGFEEGSQIYTGSAAVFLAILGVAACWSRLAVRAGLCVALGGVLFALGGDNVLHGVLYSLIPVVNKARSPSMASAILQLGLALVAAHAFEGPPAAWIRRVQRSAVAFGLLVFFLWYAQVLFKAPGWRGDPRIVIAAMLALLMAALFEGWKSGAVSVRAVQLASIGIVMIELGHGGPANMRHKLQGYPELERLAADKPIIEKLRTLPPGRVDWSVDGLHNFASWNGIDSWYAYLASITSNLYSIGFTGDRPQEIFGVRYRVSKQPGPMWNREVGTAGEWKIFENPNALPQAWVVHKTEKIDATQTLAYYGKTEWSPRTTALVTATPPALESCDAGDAYLLSRVSNRVKLWAEMPCRGMVVLSDIYYPGWKVTVDGRAAELMEVNGCMRGVVVEKGAHRIEMRYSPWTFYAGLLLTLAGVAAAMAACRLDN
ncbi:MAG: YfhO family protein [Bryobacteraceae bacterium]